MPEAARTKLRKLLDVKLSSTRKKNRNCKVAKPEMHNTTGQLSEEQRAKNGGQGQLQQGCRREQKASRRTWNTFMVSLDSDAQWFFLPALHWETQFRNW